MRDVSGDVFIIDDLMLYDKDGDYESISQGVEWRYGWLQKELELETNADFLYEAFSDTHDLNKLLTDQGYLVITPKEAVDG